VRDKNKGTKGTHDKGKGSAKGQAKGKKGAAAAVAAAVSNLEAQQNLETWRRTW